MNLSDYFDAVFCINLERRNDRLARAKQEFEKHGIQVEFITGVDGLTINIPKMTSTDGQIVSRGDIGCALSHLKVAQIAQERNLKKYLVFEDDAQLKDDFNTLFPVFYKQVPEDYQFLYFGGNHNGGLMMVSENIARIYRTFTTHAYVVNGNEPRDAIIEVLSKENEKVDIAIASLHHKFRSYCFRPHIAFQRASYSDILERHTDYQHLRQ